MAKFRFRLEKLLDYRRMQEEWAKDAYLDARAKRLETERSIEEVHRKRVVALRTHSADLRDLRALEAYLTRLDDDERALQAAVAVLLGEEEEARNAWLRARQEAETLARLREKELEEFELEESRREQRELDEWAILRRAA